MLWRGEHWDSILEKWICLRPNGLEKLICLRSNIGMEAFVDESWDWLTLHPWDECSFLSFRTTHHLSKDRKHPLKTRDMCLNIAWYCIHVAHVRDVWDCFRWFQCTLLPNLSSYCHNYLFGAFLRTCFLSFFALPVVLVVSSESIRAVSNFRTNNCWVSPHQRPRTCRRRPVWAPSWWCRTASGAQGGQQGGLSTQNISK